MKFSQLTAAALLTATSTFAQEEPVRCALPPADPELSRVLGQAAIPPPPDPNAPARRLSTIPIDTYVHVVTGDALAGRYTQQMIDDQVSVCQLGFKLPEADEGLLLDASNGRLVPRVWIQLQHAQRYIHRKQRMGRCWTANPSRTRHEDCPASGRLRLVEPLFRWSNLSSQHSWLV